MNIFDKKFEELVTEVEILQHQVDKLGKFGNGLWDLMPRRTLQILKT